MCMRCLGFVLLLWFPGVLHAQTAAQPCPAPRLNEGYFVPKLEVYSHGETLSYACDEGHKPAVEGWWATSTCENGKWSPQPQCINEKACFHPDIPNAAHPDNANSWYEERSEINIACDNGYEPKATTVTCVNGAWSSAPVCNKSVDACGEPPQIPHAVIIYRGHQEVFAAGSKVQYQCEGGYDTEGANTQKFIICSSGNWSEGPVCKSLDACGEPPHIPHAAIINQGQQKVFEAGSNVRYECEDGYTTEGTNTQKFIICSSGSWSEGPICRSSTSSGSNDGGHGHSFATIDRCGDFPVVQNGEVVQTGLRSLKYQCANYYKLVGRATVTCYRDGTWSVAPTCKAAFCSVDTSAHPELKSVGVKYIKDGESERLECTDVWRWTNYSEAQCTDGKVKRSRCCNWTQLNLVSVSP
uniref:Complement factor H-related protein 1-like n=1 Tax=Acanthochromis polyacanthus TaxID=80966 RepID=A0A3Q1F9K6_9TELE